MEVIALLIGVAMLSTLWGFMCKAVAAGKNLDERSAFWIGFIGWLVGLIILLATPARTEKR